MFFVRLKLQFRKLKTLTKDRIKEFREDRERLNKLVMKYAGINTKRFHNIDRQVYNDGALKSKTKELMGLVSSLVLRFAVGKKVFPIKSWKKRWQSG